MNHKSIRVVSWNICCGNFNFQGENDSESPSDKSIEYISNRLTQISPGIVGLQEVVIEKENQSKKNAGEYTCINSIGIIKLRSQSGQCIFQTNKSQNHRYPWMYYCIEF